jgi:hypothetical protein
MKIDGSISVATSSSAATARAAEKAGYDGAWTAETNHDPFLACVVAAEHSERLKGGGSRWASSSMTRSSMPLRWSPSPNGWLLSCSIATGVWSRA